MELQLEDLETLTQQSKGKQKEGEFTDFEIAIETYKQEMEQYVTSEQDRNLCRSVARAVQSDGNILLSLLAEEKQARVDRSLACRLSGTSATSAANVPDNTHPLDDRVLLKFAALNLERASKSFDEPVDSMDDHPGQMAEAINFTLDQAADSKGESSARGAAQFASQERYVEWRDCASCAERHEVTNLASLPCSHEYCTGCLETLIELSTVDESLFPPRCCKQPIPVNEFSHILGPTLVGQFKAKEIEFGTPNRTYCHQPKCSTFVPSQFVRGDVAICPACQSKTCVLCKGAAHDKECPQDEASQEVLRIAQKNGWQRCKNCHRMVELDYGCNHISEFSAADLISSEPF
ncbi:hypothetical protein HIM_02224 [Hirsutella minnesotensis 3608]|nr:hypothetical protein HIM_02224 [Hirsutella minnesotensis 3608]